MSTPFTRSETWEDGFILDEVILTIWGYRYDNLVTTSEVYFDAGVILGWISVACGVLFLAPQIWTNYRLKSGEGVSLGFIVTWLLGDLANFTGAFLQHLMPTLIVLAVWYTLCDIILLFQTYHYRRLGRLYPDKFPPTSDDRVEGASESAVLVGRDAEEEGTRSRIVQAQVPNTSRPDSVSRCQGPYASSKDITSDRTPLLSGARKEVPLPPHAPIVEIDTRSRARRDPLTTFRPSPIYLVLLGILAGVALSIFSVLNATHRPSHVTAFRSHPRIGISRGKKGADGPDQEEWDPTAQIVGWISTVLYLASRIPQISKNSKTKCEGLALSLFILSVLGDFTYVLSILIPPVAFIRSPIKSSTGQSPYLRHISINLPWLVGAGGTIFLDLIIFGQFFWYSKQRMRGQAVKN